MWWVDQRGSEELSLGECRRLLALGSKEGLIGRLAVAGNRAPIVHPVNFTYRDGTVVVRLGPGTMAASAPGALVAFEVDHVDHRTGRAWSVLVRGLAFPLEVRAGEGGAETPEPLVVVPGDVVLGVRLDVVTGRRFPLRDAPPTAGGTRHFVVETQSGGAR